MTHVQIHDENIIHIHLVSHQAKFLNIDHHRLKCFQSKIVKLEVKLAERPWQEDSSSILHVHVQ